VKKSDAEGITFFHPSQ